MKRTNGDLFPTLTTDLLENRFFVPSLLDWESSFLDRGNRVPPANILETKDDFRLDLSVPGMKRDDFDVEVENGILTISAEKKKESKEDTENYKRREFSYSSFCRTFTLPENVLEDKINAKYDNGMLKVQIPKKEPSETKPRKAIKVA